MSRKRRLFDASFKAKVALEAVRGLKTTSELVQQYRVHPTQIGLWKKQLLEGAAAVFEAGSAKKPTSDEPESAELYEQIGRLKVELEWLKKKLPRTSEEVKHWIDWDHPRLSVRRQCDVLGVHRSRLYYEALPESAANLSLMRQIDAQYLETPFWGSRNMREFLRRKGHGVNRKRIQRLMRKMGLEGLAPGPATSKPEPGHTVYPYLLRNLPIVRANQVWSSDITYVPLRQGFLYLVAVMDWFSRLVLSWRLSNSLDVEFCLEALDDALAQGRPEIFNTDQGAQFTSTRFTERLHSESVEISMDGRGRALDNAFIERLWRSVKYEDIYLKEYATGADCQKGLSRYFDFYCHARPHQGLDYRTPWEVHHTRRSCCR